MKFTIPDSFEIAGRTYEVKYVKKCTDCSDDVTGQVRYGAGVVELVKNIEDCDDATNVVFFHELVHSILFAMRENPRNDEKFVSRFAELLYQAIKTMEKEENNG